MTTTAHNLSTMTISTPSSKSSIQAIMTLAGSPFLLVVRSNTYIPVPSNRVWYLKHIDPVLVIILLKSISMKGVPCSENPLILKDHVKVYSTHLLTWDRHKQQHRRELLQLAQPIPSQDSSLSSYLIRLLSHTIPPTNSTRTPFLPSLNLSSPISFPRPQVYYPDPQYP